MDLIPLLYVHSSLPCSFPLSPNICLHILILKPFLHLLNFLVCLFIWLRKAVIAKKELQLLISYTTFVVLPPIIMLFLPESPRWLFVKVNSHAHAHLIFLQRSFHSSLSLPLFRIGKMKPLMCFLRSLTLLA